MASYATVLYTIQGELDGDDDPYCFLVPVPASGVLRAMDLLSRFPPSIVKEHSAGSGDAGWLLVGIDEAGQRLDLDSPAAVVPMRRGGIVVLEAIPLGKSPP
jgi:hypothetical protein